MGLCSKMTYLESRNMWKLYWMRADLKWHLYEEYKNLDDLLQEVKKDPNGFFGDKFLLYLLCRKPMYPLIFPTY